jgi:hypothetical protein
MKTTSRTSSRQGIIRVPKSRLRGFPKDAEAIEKWILAIGGKPMSKATERQLKEAGLWGMPDE